MLLNLKGLLSKIRIGLVVKIIIGISAYIFIIFKLSNSSEHLILYNSNIDQSYGTLLIAICFFLMPLNWLIESYKWKILLKNFEKISIGLAIKSVLFGLTSAIFTPYRIGEFFGRPLLISRKKRFQAVLATFIGSLAQNVITISMSILGLVVLKFFLTNQINFISINYSAFYIIVVVADLCFLCLYFYPQAVVYFTNKIRFLRKWLDKFQFINNYKFHELLYILSLSQLRYLVFFSQFFLLLLFFNVPVNIYEAFCAISLSYLFLFSIPGLPILEPGIRGSLALYFVGQFSNNDFGILSATICLWILNLAIPSLIGAILVFKADRNDES